MDETSAEASRLQVWILLCAGHLDTPHLLPGVIQLDVDRVDSGVMRGHRVAHVGGYPVLLEEENIRVKKKTKERRGNEKVERSLSFWIQTVNLSMWESQENNAACYPG